MRTVRIGDKNLGKKGFCFIVAEIGINHNGDINIAKQLIDATVHAGCDAVKFQKRTVEVVYTQEELAQPRPNPFGPTNGDLKKGLELGKEEYIKIDKYCKKKKIAWFASCWDEKSVDFIEQFDPPCYKIASPCLTHNNLLKYMRSKKKPIILSTGMSTIKEIDTAVEILGKKDLIITHCTSTYPSKPNELNLLVIHSLRKRYGMPVGYSGHEVGLTPSIVAAAHGACYVERHITLDRSMWGSDQAASVEPQGMERLVKNIRSVPTILGNGRKRVHDSEKPVLKKLRKVKGWL